AFATAPPSSAAVGTWAGDPCTQRARHIIVPGWRVKVHLEPSALLGYSDLLDPCARLFSQAPTFPPVCFDSFPRSATRIASKWCSRHLSSPIRPVVVPVKRARFWRNSEARSASGGTSRFTVSPESRDRKSTRLNSSHVSISYAVFCLKKKKK